jgi:SAM-dependent methyltransferase
MALHNMLTSAIQRQYDEVIAPHYDLDPQAVVGRSLDQALEHLVQHGCLAEGVPLRVLDLGMGTGAFLARLRARDQSLRPFGIDISEKMIDIARDRIPGLEAVADDATNLDAHFPGVSFDLVCTHFVTGFVPLGVLAPKICGRLARGGYWSLVGGTKAGFPALRKKASGRAARLLFGGRSLGVDDLVCNPADRDEVVQTMERNGFAVRECVTFTPRLDFRNFDEFMRFAYYGGWLTPFIESLGLHTAGRVARAAVNALFFPAQDHHCIEIVLAQKIGP